MVNKWLNISLFWFFPRHCLICGDSYQLQALCPDCLQELKANHYACICCAEPLDETQQNHLCGKCLKQQPYFDRVISPYLYQPPLDRLVTRFKFHADLSAGRVLARLLAEHIRQQVQQLPDCLVPVPLHYFRLRQRGFNQSQEISRVLGKQLQIPVKFTLCARQRKTSSQSGLNEKQRRKNIRGAFKVTGRLPYKHVAIIDDVMTTGNTVNEIAKLLRKAGAETIQVWSVCRAANRK